MSTRGTNVWLIALPWNDYKLPQPALGALAAYLADREPGWTIQADYAYVDVAAGDPELYAAVSTTDFEGERLYATLMYPDGVAPLIDYWERLTERTALGVHLHKKVRPSGTSIAEAVRDLRSSIDRHLDALVASRDWNDTVIGLTTSFSQMFANILFAQRVKATGANVTIVLGGSTVSPASIADSILATYPAIDYIVRGEGELPLHALIAQLERGETAPLRGVVSRTSPAASGGMWQVPDLDTLPTPDYDAFYKRIGPSRGRIAIPIEGSRGCWWDRTTKNAKATCHFCNLNIQWDGFRQKSGRRVATEMRELATRHRGAHFNFLDNIVRIRGYDELIDAIGSLDLDARIFHEARANLRPPDILRFFEVGLRAVQFGLEGLSGSFLKRINKGTTPIMNLEVMKTCAELGVRSYSNLIVDFPGSTQAEVDETLRIIDRHAFGFEPPSIAGFELGIDSVVAKFPDEFGLSNLRNHELYAAVIPPAALATLQLFQYSFDRTPTTVDWWPVIERVEEWKRDYKPHPMWYQDGGDFLHVFRTRPGRKMETYELDGDEAAVYRFCMQIRTDSDLLELLAHGSSDRAAELEAALAGLVKRDLVYQESAKYLSLAVAPDPSVATRRIRSQRTSTPRRLAVAR